MDLLEELDQLDASTLITPCLLVFPQRIRANLEAAIRIAGSADRLRMHVKTHKCSEIVRMQTELGITKHKCATLGEAQMLGECGAADVLIAYPQLGPAIARLAEIVARFPETRFSTVVESQAAASALDEHFAEAGMAIDVFLDIDCGMHRTGIPPGDGALQLYRQVTESQALRIRGLHVYDGQNHQSLLNERESAVAAEMRDVAELVNQIKAQQLPTPTLVCGGTPTFPVFADLALTSVGSESDDSPIELSPGTCVLSDYNYGKDYADLSEIQHAAVLMTRVISKQHTGRLTVDLGNKAVAADPPAGKRCHFLQIDDAREIKHNEEHLAIESSQADAWSEGDILFVIPAHICPTVALHREMQIVESGQLTGRWTVDARDRIYS